MIINKTIKGNRLIVTTVYKGEWVKAQATCAESDVFNEEAGTKIALARLEKKIASRRLRYAKQDYKFWSDFEAEIHNCRVMRVGKTVSAAQAKYDETCANLEKVLKEV